MDASRALLNGTPTGDTLTQTLTWSAALFVVFCPLAIRAYSRDR